MSNIHRLIEKIQKAFPVDEYRSTCPTKAIKTVAPWRSELERLVFADALDVFGDVLIDLLIAYKIDGDWLPDDHAFVLFLDANGSRRKKNKEFSILSGPQRKVVYEWLVAMKSSLLADKEPEAYQSALKYWAGKK